MQYQALNKFVDTHRLYIALHIITLNAFSMRSTWRVIWYCQVYSENPSAAWMGHEVIVNIWSLVLKYLFCDRSVSLCKWGTMNMLTSIHKEYGKIEINPYWIRTRQIGGGLKAVTGLVILLRLDSNRRFFGAYDNIIYWMTSQKNRAPVPCYVKPCALFQSHQWIQTGVTVRKRSICPVWIWRTTLKNNMAPLLCNFKHFVTFHSHRSIQTVVSVRKRPI